METLLLEKNFYTYIYLDTRKLGKYVYGDYSFDYEPFYVGKGKNEQYMSHLNESIKYLNKSNDFIIEESNNPHKTFKIQKILKDGLKPVILKVEKKLLEHQAFDLEIWLIWAIGRSDLKLGPLTNLTDGGEGLSGIIVSGTIANGVTVTIPVGSTLVVL